MLVETASQYKRKSPISLTNKSWLQCFNENALFKYRKYILNFLVRRLKVFTGTVSAPEHNEGKKKWNRIFCRVLLETFHQCKRHKFASERYSYSAYRASATKFTLSCTWMYNMHCEKLYCVSGNYDTSQTQTDLAAST